MLRVREEQRLTNKMMNGGVMNDEFSCINNVFVDFDFDVEIGKSIVVKVATKIKEIKEN